MLIDSVKFNKGDRPIKSVGAETIRMLPFDWLIVGDNFVFKKLDSKLCWCSGIGLRSYNRVVESITSIVSEELCG